MSSLTAWADLQARIGAAAIAVDGAVLPVFWPNMKRNTPAGAFLLIEMTGGSSRPISLGGENWLSEGQAMIHVMVPVNTGVTGVFGIVDQVEAMFRGPPHESVVYERVTSDPGGPGSDDGNWWRTSVTADWHLQTIVPRS